MIELTPSVHLYERHDWAARAWRDFTPQALNGEAYIHHTADTHSELIDHLDEQKRAMRATQDFHMDTRGWSDIAYHFIVMQAFGTIPHARIFEGRPIAHVPAAQLGHNTGTFVVCVHGDFDHELVKRNTIYAIETLLDHHRSRLHSLGGHRDAPGQSTDCPGANLYAAIDHIARATNLKRIRR